jgi:hypothetical protein
MIGLGAGRYFDLVTFAAQAIIAIPIACGLLLARDALR